MTEDFSYEHRIEHIPVDEIKVGDRLRSDNSDEVERIAESVTRIGLQTPITVRETEDSGKILVSGLHRLKAVKSLDWSTIPCRVVRIDDRIARLWEIAEKAYAFASGEISIL
jgi:ParB-like chromosome segregation protein Spo0J